MTRRWLAALATLLAGCATPPSAPPRLDAALAARPVWLLGEVHDNAQGHRLRTELLAQRLAAGWRPAIAMEQFDRERQADLDAALRDCADAECVVARAGGAKAAWQWAYYTPVIALAQRYRLPLLAANLSRADAGRVMREGYGAALDAATVQAFGLDRPLPADLEAGQRHEVDVGHCGQLPSDLLPGMARAQVARDVWMAKVVREHADGVVLLAGNGHVRRDLGVPRWLHGVPGQRVASIGFVEAPTEAGRFDQTLLIPAAQRPDPCAGVKAGK
ncbi:ChaN family lipoprotein [Chitiniphilus shinanonensis]|uniref:ChaN family lipoprotein n=2 Tax=Chitiniphilus shinanonensis TaxID=553088 RepID=UPI00036F7BB2|nr:ChaN family lipoprotein [Chitiniphilus shinanonensis]